MNINELQPGDVLLFSGEKGSTISEAIMYLSNAPVSHAAMAYTHNGTIVEATPPAVQTNQATERFVDRKISVMRCNPPHGSYDPVLAAATGYLNDQAPYANANLYLVALLLIYRKFTPDTLTQRIIISILKKITAAIITYYNEHKFPGQLPMVCSQLVYQCYEDAGDAYRLQIEGGVLARTALTVGPVAPSLLDQAITRVRSVPTAAFRDSVAANSGLFMGAPEEQSDEELAASLLAALRTAPQPGVDAATTLDDALVVAIHEFGQAIQVVRTGVAAPLDELLRANTLRMATNGMAQLKSEEAYFVAPGDLLLHCSNLVQVGEINI